MYAHARKSNFEHGRAKMALDSVGIDPDQCAVTVTDVYYASRVDVRPFPNQ